MNCKFSVPSSGRPTHGLWYHLPHSGQFAMYLETNCLYVHTPQFYYIRVHNRGCQICSSCLCSLNCWKGEHTCLSVHAFLLTVAGLSPEANAKHTATAKRPQFAPPRCCCIGTILTLSSDSLWEVVYRDFSLCGLCSMNHKEKHLRIYNSNIPQ